MSNVANYLSSGNSLGPINPNTTSQEMKRLAEYLHGMRPILMQEHMDLELKLKTHPNSVFPIKMEAISAIYQAAVPLYEWYVEKAKR